MSWIHRFNRIMARGSAAQPPGPEPVPVPAPKLAAPASPPPALDNSVSAQAKRQTAAKRPLSPHLANRAAAVKAVAETMRKTQNQIEAAANARALLARMGVNVPPPAVPPAPRQLLSAERQALIAEAMSHWAHGHAIYERLDPGLKERIRHLAERMAPK